MFATLANVKMLAVAAVAAGGLAIGTQSASAARINFGISLPVLVAPQPTVVYALPPSTPRPFMRPRYASPRRWSWPSRRSFTRPRQSTPPLRFMSMKAGSIRASISAAGSGTFTGKTSGHSTD